VYVYFDNCSIKLTAVATYTSEFKNLIHILIRRHTLPLKINGPVTTIL
jgi:hypothetical protein